MQTDADLLLAAAAAPVTVQNNDVVSPGVALTTAAAPMPVSADPVSNIAPVAAPGGINENAILLALAAIAIGGVLVFDGQSASVSGKKRKKKDDSLTWLLLLAAAGGAYWYFTRDKNPAAATTQVSPAVDPVPQTAPVAPAAPGGGIVSYDPAVALPANYLELLYTNYPKDQGIYATMQPAELQSWYLFLVGSSDPAVIDAAQTIRAKYPGLHTP